MAALEIFGCSITCLKDGSIFGNLCVIKLHIKGITMLITSRFLSGTIPCLPRLENLCTDTSK